MTEPSLACLRETAWETRNLGRASFAVTESFWEAPDFSALGVELSALRGTRGPLFAYARLGRERLPLVPQVQALGFYVVECTVSPVMMLHRNPVLRDFEADPAPFIPRRYRGEDLKFETLKAVTPEWARALEAMARESFSDDRFHRDHRCPPGIADQRFAWWMGDLLRDPGIGYDVLSLRGTPVAFVAHRGNHMIISGFDARHTSSGLGEYFWLAICSAAKRAGHNHVHTVVSVNNLPSLNLCARCGFRFKDTAYGFHLWLD